MVQDDYVDVLLKVIKIIATLTKSCTMVYEHSDKLEFRKTHDGTLLTCDVCVNSNWEPLLCLSTKTDVSYDYMKRNSQKYREILVYRSDTEEYWTFDGTVTCYSSDDVKDNAFIFNLSTVSTILSKNIEVLKYFRETEEAQNLIDASGYHIMINRFSDNITPNLKNILQKGIIRK